MTPILRATLLAVLTASSIPAVAAGQEAPTDSLLRRIDLLERRTSDLERRVRDLEALISTEPVRPRPAGVSPESRDLQNWRRLRLNMTMDQVRALLGEPERVAAGSPWTFWYWDAGSAYVRFDSRSDKVDAWTEPGR